MQTARANVETARLNLSYTTITAPVSGLSSFARVQDGAYVSAANSLLTYVEQVDPIWVNFTLSENDLLGIRSEQQKGRLRLPPKDDATRSRSCSADGSVYPRKGRITFANADYNPQTGTFLLRATLPNPEGALRPGQFVRVRVLGAVRVERDPRAAAGGAAGREGTLRDGGRQGGQGADPRRPGGAVVRRRLVHHRGAAGGETSW